MFLFEIYTEKYTLKAKLSFMLNDKEYSYNLKIYTPDCDQYENQINAHYFCYEKINEYGAKQNYIEYVNCFEELALNINTDKILRLFDLDINKDDDEKNIEKIKNLFLE